MSDEVFGQDLPSTEMLTERFKGLVEYWSNRNKFVIDMRQALAGLNEIEAPKSTQYTIKTLHAHMLATIVSQKVSGYLSVPNIQVVPEFGEEGVTPEARKKSTEIERGLNVGLEEMARRPGGRDAWDKVVLDVVYLGTAVEKWLCAPNAFWPDIVAHDVSYKLSKLDKKAEVVHARMGDKDRRHKYKMSQGIPFIRRYVPLERSYPYFDDDELKGIFEVSEHSLAAVCSNKLFENEDGSRILEELRAEYGPDGGVKETCNIVEYANNRWHAYYLSGKKRGQEKWPKVNTNSLTFEGDLRLLYKYEHGIPVNPYNVIGGRFGVWMTEDSRMENVGKALMELSQANDDLLSQFYTNVRATKWPRMKFTMDPEKRGWGTDHTKAKAPAVPEGEALVLFVGEDAQPFFTAEDDPVAWRTWDKIEEQLNKLGGNPVLFGNKDPGVDNGYQQALQKTTAEDFDEKVMQGISHGATQGAMRMMFYAMKIGEKIPMQFVALEGKRKQNKVVKVATLDPDMLDPLPRLDAQVKKPSPMDYLTNLRAAKEASDEREGKGPLLSEDTIRADILSLDAPDEEKFKILVESQQREIVASGVLSSKIGDMINIKLAKAGTPEISPEMMGKIDPALLASIQAQAMPGGQGPVSGGNDPGMLASAAETAGLPPGPLPGDPEMENRLGEAALMNSQTGAG